MNCQTLKYLETSACYFTTYLIEDKKTSIQNSSHEVIKFELENQMEAVAVAIKWFTTI